jgi:hypothetical protein
MKSSIIPYLRKTHSDDIDYARFPALRKAGTCLPAGRYGLLEKIINT